MVMSDIKKTLYKEFIIKLIKVTPENLSNKIYLKNVHWIRRYRKSKSEDIYLDLYSLLALKLYNDKHTKQFVKLLTKKTKRINSNQHLVLDFSKTLDVSYDFIKCSCKALVEKGIISKESIDGNRVIILASNEIKRTFTKYFNYYLSQKSIK